MKKMSMGLVFGIGAISIAIVNTAFARSHVGRGTIISGELFGRVGLCWTDMSNSSDPTQVSYGIVLALESGNGNEIAADIYSLDANRKKIKQVGHADVTATNTSGEFTLSGATDSPSQFSLTITPRDYSSGEPREHGIMSATLANAALFSGDLVSNTALKCDVADLNRLPTPNPGASASPSPSPSVDPSPTPSAQPSTSASTAPSMD